MVAEHTTPNSGVQLLSAFINAAAEANIIAGVQVKLLIEFAQQYCNDSCEASAQVEAPQLQQRQLDAAATVSNTLPPHLEQAAVPSTSLPEAPQLQIQPLNLTAGLGVASTRQQEATCFGAVPALGPAADPAADGSSHHAAALMAFSGSMAGSYDAATAAAAAAALLQQAPYASAAAGQQQLGEPCPTSAGLLGPSHELLQALGYAADATAAAQAAPAAATAAAAAGPTVSAADAAAACKTSGPRKQRFTREQHAAILESVERNYAQYPSRYTELVIKEMQALFPGIELNNACVRKIKFRANEASKQLTPQQQQDYAATVPDYQAADAAHGLVGLASAAAAAAAAGAYTDYASMPEYTPEPTAVTEQLAACAVKTEADLEAGTGVGGAQQEGSRPGSPSAAAAAAALDTLQAPSTHTPETVGVSKEAEGAMLAVVEQQREQQPAQQDGNTSAAQAAGKDSRAGSPSSSGLQVKVPAPAARSAAPGEDCVDSATAAAAEAMHLLAGISNGKQQQAAVCVGPATAARTVAGDAGDADADGSVAAAAAAAVAAAAAAVPGGKRKRESGSGGGDGSASGTAASSPLPGQVAEALSAAADLAGTGAAATTQDQQPQGHNSTVLDPAAAAAYMSAPGQAAYDQQQLLLQHHEQQQQQHSLMQQLLQLQQQQQQPAWDLAYSNQLGPLDLHQQALQMQLGAAGLGSSGNLAALQQHMQLQAPAAAAAAAGQQPAAKRQRLSGAQMAELIASVKHHVQVNPERYTHCVIKDMKEKYPDLELNMGQIRKIKFRTLGNVNCGKQSAKAGAEPSSSAGARGADPAAAAAAAGCSGASGGF